MNDVLGYRQCPTCDTRATVHQSKGKRVQLYQRCGCGADQRNGKEAQSLMWFTTNWLPGLKPENPPANLMNEADYQALIERMTPTAAAARLEADTEAETEADTNKGEAQDSEGNQGEMPPKPDDQGLAEQTDTDSEAEPKPKSGGLLAIGLGILAGGALLVMKARG